jgi:hypothetical protein
MVRDQEPLVRIHRPDFLIQYFQDFFSDRFIYIEDLSTQELRVNLQ